MGTALKSWTIAALIAGVVLFASQLAEIPHRSALRGYDNTFNYLWIRSAMVDGDWNFRNDLDACDTLPDDYREAALALQPTDAGRIPNKYGIGWAVLSLPFYLIADAIVGIAHSLGVRSLERDGFNWVYQVVIQLGHFGLALSALLLAWKTISRWLGDARSAWMGVLSVWAASSLLYYQTSNLSMSHAASFFLIATMAFALERARSYVTRDHDRLGWWLLAGAAFGLAIITRFQLAVFGIVVAWFALAKGEGYSATPGKSARLIALAIGGMPFVALQMWAWHVVYGHWLVFGYGGEGDSFHWFAPELLKSLFSSWHGLVYWHPFLVVASAGAVAWMKARRGMSVAWGLAAAATLYVNASWSCWWFASSFGSRAFDAALLPLMAGAAWLFVRAKGRWRTILCAVAIVAAVWNGYVVLLYRSAAISRGDPVTWTEMISSAARLPESLRF